MGVDRHKIKLYICSRFNPNGEVAQAVRAQDS